MRLIQKGRLQMHFPTAFFISASQHHTRHTHNKWFLIVFPLSHFGDFSNIAHSFANKKGWLWGKNPEVHTNFKVTVSSGLLWRQEREYSFSRQSELIKQLRLLWDTMRVATHLYLVFKSTTTELKVRTWFWCFKRMFSPYCFSTHHYFSSTVVDGKCEICILKMNGFLIQLFGEG